MNIITRAQELGKKAAELSKAVHALPGKAAEIREAVTMTGGELKQLRTDVQTSLHALRADSEDRLLGAMRDINDHAQVFEEAGYDLSGIELDLVPTQRLSVRLDRFEEVPHATLRSLLSRQTTDTMRSMLNGIIKAEETAANVELSHLTYSGLIIHVGAIPMIRLCWRDAAAAPAPAANPAIPAAAAFPASAPPAPASMFDLRPLPSGTVRIESKPAPVVPEAGSAVQAPALSGGGWSQDALARFKKMPGVSKYAR